MGGGRGVRVIQAIEFSVYTGLWPHIRLCASFASTPPFKNHETVITHCQDLTYNLSEAPDGKDANRSIAETAMGVWDQRACLCLRRFRGRHV